MATTTQPAPATKNHTRPDIERDLGLPHDAMSEAEHPAAARATPMTTQHGRR